MHHSLPLRSLVALLFALGGLGCPPGTDDDDDAVTDDDDATGDDDDATGDDDDSTEAVGWTLQILHASDMESGGALVLDAPRFAAVLSALRAEHPSRTVALAAGDLFGPGAVWTGGADPSLDAVLGAAGRGRAEVALASAMGFAAAAIGHHEFDAGPAGLALAHGSSGAWDGAGYPLLSCNVHVAIDPDLGSLLRLPGDDVSTLRGAITKYATVLVDGERIGLIGATTPELDEIAWTGNDVLVTPPDDLLSGLAGIVQEKADALEDDGVDKIILLAHLHDLALETELAGMLEGVDVIIAGGSGAILADADDRLRAGDTAADTYPRWVTSARDEPIAVVSTDGDWRYVGRLLLGFDDAGVIIEDSVGPASGAWATDDEGVSAAGSPAVPADVAEIIEALDVAITAPDGVILGRSDVWLSGQEAAINSQETNLGDLVGDAALALARTQESGVAAALLHAGAFLGDIGISTVPRGALTPGERVQGPPLANSAAGKSAGDVSQLDVTWAVAAGGLSLVTVTATDLVGMLEHCVSAAPGAPRFCQVAGAQFSFDPAQAAGVRVQTVRLQSGDVIAVDGAIQGDASRSIRLVVPSAMADGAEGFWVPAPGRQDLTAAGLGAGAATFAPAGTVRDALAEWLLAEHTTTPVALVESPPSGDLRVQDLSARAESIDTSR